MTHEDRLIKICSEAMNAAIPVSKDKTANWMSRIFQVGHHEVTEKKFATWLLIQSDYWYPKDEDYANYLTGLAETFDGDYVPRWNKTNPAADRSS